ncbi:MAG: hypothetical protein ABUK01_17975 [Leptospirales bacterium]
MSDALKPQKVPKAVKNFALVILFLFSQFLYAAATYEDFVSKGNRNLKIIERLYFKYPLAPVKRKIAFKIIENWNSITLQYPDANRNDRKTLYVNLKTEYSKSNSLLRDISIELANLFDRTYNSIASRIIDAELPTAQRNDALSRMQIAKQEFARAEAGYRNKQFYYSSHLYDRSITILLNIYNTLNWEMPASAIGIIL